MEMKAPVRRLMSLGKGSVAFPTGFLTPSGFTLIEMVVSIAIIGILTTMIAVGYPAVRDRQTLQRAHQQLEVLVREAAQQTLNEERAAACRDRFPGDALAAVTSRRRCSDVGIHIQGATATLFADLDGNKAYSVNRDYNIRDPIALPAPVTEAATIVFNASPPYLTLYGNASLVDDQHPFEVVLQLHGGTNVLVIRPYGKVEQR